LAPEGVLEFVPKEDPMVKELLALRGDLFPDYNEGEFRDAIRSRGRIVSEMQVPGTQRTLIHYSKIA
jgi:hypothetical protein